MKDEERENEPVGVGASPTHAGEATAGGEEDRWPWAERAIWTERMLEVLETGPKGGRWYSLKDKVFAVKTLTVAWGRVLSNHGAAGIDRVSCERFESRAEALLAELHEDLRTGRYRPEPVLRRYIPKADGKLRPLGIPAVRDRIVQTALRLVLEPIWEVRFHEHSYGFRPRRGCKDALRRVDGLLSEGYVWVVDADIESYFDSIDHRTLMSKVGEHVADRSVLDLVHSYLSQDIVDEVKRWTPERGTPQGAVISPLLANIYLDAMDRALEAAGYEHVRYADDFVILCRSKEDAEAALAVVRGELGRLRLTLHPEKTQLVDARDPGGFDFLGYHFERGYRWPRAKNVTSIRERIKALTPRTSGESMERVIAHVNPLLRGWYGYFKHSHRTVHRALDSYVRARLRGILRRRAGRQGRARGRDHQRWPNAHFKLLGLFSLEAARAAEIQSRC